MRFRSQSSCLSTTMSNTAPILFPSASVYLLGKWIQK